VALTGIVVILVALVRSPERYRGQMVLLLVFAGVPLVASVVQLLVRPGTGLVTLAVPISGGAAALAIFRHGLLDMIPAARHTIIENMSDAVLVLDQSHRVVDLNPAARRIVTRSGASAVGQPIVELLPESSRSLSAAIAGSELREAEVALDGRDYELRISPVRNKDGSGSRTPIKTAARRGLPGGCDGGRRGSRCRW
jgi:PAS domain S-box-containing protein